MGAKKKPKEIAPFSVKLTLEPKMVMDLMCTAFEGGMSARWARVVKTDGGKGAQYSHEIPFFGGTTTIKDLETGELHGLDLNAVKIGLEKMSRDYPKHFGDFLDKNDDAITGDVFLQCCLLGKVVYG